MAPKKTEKKAAEEEESFVCPMCLVVRCLRDMVDRKSPFFEHMNNARIEFLEGIKSLIDERIEAIKKGAGTRKSRLTKIKVED
ncbi:MAG: hypothetical protein JRF30_07790 [Deltaproteobacteria bacterium]|nr:hypothetical protein [Deltaproteobacteria bacterium]MBW1794206.1 hypothetical protein [Deltaproteobacteria bacterium]MBW2330816.1 hypothetical protein [Deltaproteobacteria bacterium]